MPARIGALNPPRLCAMFHMPCGAREERDGLASSAGCWGRGRGRSRGRVGAPTHHHPERSGARTQYVPRSLVANQPVRIFAHAGAPQPCAGKKQSHPQQRSRPRVSAEWRNDGSGSWRARAAGRACGAGHSCWQGYAAARTRLGNACCDWDGRKQGLNAGAAPPRLQDAVKRPQGAPDGERGREAERDIHERCAVAERAARARVSRLVGPPTPNPTRVPASGGPLAGGTKARRGGREVRSRRRKLLSGIAAAGRRETGACTRPRVLPRLKEFVSSGEDSWRSGVPVSRRPVPSITDGDRRSPTTPETNLLRERRAGRQVGWSKVPKCCCPRMV